MYRYFQNALSTRSFSFEYVKKFNKIKFQPRFTFTDLKLQPTRCNVSWFIYFYRRCTCFRRFLRPSSRAHNCTYNL